MNILRAGPDVSLTQLDKVDYSLIVHSVAEPPFDGGDIVNVREVTPFRKVYSLPTASNGSYIASSGSALFIAMEGQRIAGFLAVAIVWDGLAQIDDLAVGTNFRGGGIGTQLLAKAIDFGFALDATGISAETQTINMPACRFYPEEWFSTRRI